MAEDNGDFIDDNSESQLDENGENIVPESGENVATRGRYYLMDAGFPNAPGFLAPYRLVRYHLRDHRERTPQNPRELFNKRHSQARNITGRAFGSLKNRFSMLKTAPPYDYEVQVSIVLVCSILHNFILEH
ncbi:hypothetical protein MRB53_026056 [Persea americana]|uniref:Uncharacterized protein n=1 Tax=Persea americana TaxID=3435 RepID=A0ACC2LHI2_PERAE|nr:hypothetical protein MRB53_026056 [Persea americana]